MFNQANEEKAKQSEVEKKKAEKGRLKRKGETNTYQVTTYTTNSCKKCITVSYFTYSNSLTRIMKIKT